MRGFPATLSPEGPLYTYKDAGVWLESQAHSLACTTLCIVNHED
jgi:hypothetical protein